MDTPQICRLNFDPIYHSSTDISISVSGGHIAVFSCRSLSQSPGRTIYNCRARCDRIPKICCQNFDPDCRSSWDKIAVILPFPVSIVISVAFELDVVRTIDLPFQLWCYLYLEPSICRFSCDAISICHISWDRYEHFRFWRPHCHFRLSDIVSVTRRLLWSGRGHKPRITVGISILIPKILGFPWLGGHIDFRLSWSSLLFGETSLELRGRKLFHC